MSPTRRAPVLVLALTVAAAVVVLDRRDDGPDAAPALAEPDDGMAALVAEAKRRWIAKRALVQQLVAGRGTLAEVAARFAGLDAGKPSARLAAWYHPEATPEERYCLVVIDYADAVLAGDPRRPAVLARLRADLAAVVAARGKPRPVEPAG